MSDLFVLMEVGWEYNDEIYFRSVGGNPKKVFECNNAAKLECDKLNIERFKKLFTSGAIREYYYSLSDIIPYNFRKNKEFRAQLNQACQNIFGYVFSELEDRISEEKKIEVVESVTNEDWLKFMSMTSFIFWEIVSVKKG